MTGSPPTEQGRFADQVQASFPPGIRLPAELVAALDWLEANGHVISTPRGPYASLLSPTEITKAIGVVGAQFHPAFEFGHYWLRTDDPAVANRLAPFIDTGADGSTIGIWVDDHGHQQFVHLGSGSGSVWSNVVTDNPVDLLRLLAIGYGELCWPADHELTPERAWLTGLGDGSLTGWVAPAAFRGWVQDTFGVTIPATARELIPVPDDGDGNRADDPFGRWLDLGR